MQGFSSSLKIIEEENKDAMSNLNDARKFYSLLLLTEKGILCTIYHLSASPTGSVM